MDSQGRETNNIELDSRRPKRRKVGTVGKTDVYQLEESTGCLDCFGSMPVGTLVCLEVVAGPRPIPRCFRHNKADAGKLKLTEKVQRCTELSCPGCLDPARVDAYVPTLDKLMLTEPRY